MPKKAVVFNQESGEKLVNFTMDKPTGAAEDFVPEVIGFDLSKVDEATLFRLALHGASQKIGDSYAGAKESGEDPIKYAKEAVSETIKQLYEGKWAVTRTGSGAPRVSILVLAYAKVKGITEDAALEVLSDLSDDDKKELQKNKKIAAAIAVIRAEQAAERARKAMEAAAKEDADADAAKETTNAA